MTLKLSEEHTERQQQLTTLTTDKNFHELKLNFLTNAKFKQHTIFKILDNTTATWHVDVYLHFAVILFYGLFIQLTRRQRQMLPITVSTIESINTLASETKSYAKCT